MVEFGASFADLFREPVVFFGFRLQRRATGFTTRADWIQADAMTLVARTALRRRAESISSAAYTQLSLIRPAALSGGGTCDENSSRLQKRRT